MATESVCVPFDMPESHAEHSSSPRAKIRTHPTKVSSQQRGQGSSVLGAPLLLRSFQQWDQRNRGQDAVPSLSGLAAPRWQIADKRRRRPPSVRDGRKSLEQQLISSISLSSARQSVSCFLEVPGSPPAGWFLEELPNNPESNSHASRRSVKV